LAKFVLPHLNCISIHFNSKFIGDKPAINCLWP